MTWQECRDTSLQKLFQCYNGPDEDEATLRYLAAMPVAGISRHRARMAQSSFFIVGFTSMFFNYCQRCGG